MPRTMAGPTDVIAGYLSSILPILMQTKTWVGDIKQVLPVTLLSRQ